MSHLKMHCAALSIGRYSEYLGNRSDLARERKVGSLGKFGGIEAVAG
jgi:hypothetical protein